MPRVAVAAVAALAFMSVVHSSLAGTTRANIKLVNNGYEGILIAIAETVPVSKSKHITDRIKTFFTSASKDLFKATRNRIYFRNITILVPKSWSNNNNYGVATSETFSSANVVIDGPGLDTPTTRMQPSGRCGQPGEFIQIPKKYMLGPVTEIVRKFGFP
ncbi:Calcium-activated chloride channel regulator 1, partial [Lamellibrachia satsuma]